MPPKPGILTTEFWMNIIGILATAAVGILNLAPGELAKLPAPFGGIAAGVAGLVIPIATAWLARHYTQNRTELKLAAAAAGAGASVAKLNA